MKPIVLKKIRLLNFKGARDVEIKFSPVCTVISGRNGTGKTTVFDALTWLLFGKDSQDREKVDFKTYDSDGNIIPRIPHEVSAEISVGGVIVNLTKRLTENWVKPTGSSEQVFKGNIIERFHNDVPCTESEYKAKIAEICPELIFKYITNPSYFCSKKAEEQRAMLLDMAGVTDGDVAANNAEFNNFLKMIEGKKLAEFKKEIAAKKNRTKDEMCGIPDRIDELKRRQTVIPDWEALMTARTELESKLNDIEMQILDTSKRNETKDGKLKEIYDEIGRMRAAKSERESVVSSEALKDYTEAFNKWNHLHSSEAKIRRDIQSLSAAIDFHKSELISLGEDRERLLAVFKSISETLVTESQKELTITEDDFRCPTCGRLFEPDRIHEQQAHMTATFNASKAAKIDELKTRREDNRRQGKELNSRREAIEKQIAENEAKMAELNAQMELIIQNPLYAMMPVRPDVSSYINSDDDIKRINERIDELTAEGRALSETKESTAEAELTESRRQVQLAIKEIDSTLAGRASYERDIERIAELEAQYAVLAGNLSELEKTEFTMDAFNKAKNELIESRINGLFEVVKFRWLATQINGAVKETCEATVAGVPFAILNHAAQIDAGLDIINAICKNKGISAPIFIDNAESCNRFRDTLGQIVLLEVSDDEILKVTDY